MRPNQRYDAIVRRLGLHVASVQRTYPDAWKQIGMFREMRGSQGFQDWPPWCFCPFAGAYAVVTGGHDDVIPPGNDVAIVAQLAAWRMTKGVYDFDATVFGELWDTPVEGAIPVEALRALPEWCCYIPFPEPRRVISDLPDCVGFFVSLEYDANDGRAELRLLLDYEPLHLTAFPLHLVPGGNLGDCIDAAMDEEERQYRAHGLAPGSDSGGASSDTVEQAMAFLRREMRQVLPPLLSLVLYLCSTTAEIVGREPDLKPSNKPRIAFGKRGRREIAAERTEFWEVAWRLGRTLRAAAPGVPGPDRGGVHASPRPHIRRAHWHAFWTGPKAKGMQRETDRKLVLKWLPPIAVAIGDEDGHVIPTIHKVVN